MRKKFIIILLAVFPAFFTSCDLLDGLSDSLSEEEIVEGLKTALQLGTDSSVTELNAVDGYYKNELIKIFLPPEADPILEKIDQIPGAEQKIEDVILRLNRSAEDAVTEAKPIFIDAITSMTIEDGLNILNGVSSDSKAAFDSTAATSYLRAKTYTGLFSLYQPKIKTVLDKKLVGDYSTNESWDILTSSYNLLVPIDQRVNTVLDDYATGKALDGVFYRIGVEEKKIRKDPYQWALDILDKVFGSVYVE